MIRFLLRRICLGLVGMGLACGVVGGELEPDVGAPPVNIPAPPVAKSVQPLVNAGDACAMVNASDSDAYRLVGWTRKTLATAVRLSRLSPEAVCRLPKASRDRLRAQVKQFRQASALGLKEYWQRRVDPNEAKVVRSSSPQALKSRLPARAQAWQWVQMGPGNMYSGRVNALHFNPRNDNIIIAATNSGGIWRSTDAGKNWTKTADILGPLSLISEPAAPDHLHLFTLSSNQESWFESFDGGINWQPTTTGFRQFGTYPVKSGNQSGLAVNPKNLAISPANPNHWLLLDQLGALASYDAGRNWVRVGVVRNEGDSVSYSDIAWDPRDPHKVWATSSKGRVLIGSHFGMPNETWEERQIGPDTAFFNLIRFSRSGAYIYLTEISNQGSIYRSQDFGQTFTKVSDPIHCAPQCGYNDALWINPKNASELVLGGVQLYRSRDAGETWRVINDSVDSFRVHVDVHALAAPASFDGVSSSRLCVGNDGGVACTDNIEASPEQLRWVNLGKSINSMEFYTVNTSASHGLIVAGAQDNGTVKFQNDRNWSVVFGGDGGFSGLPSDASKPAYIGIQYGDIYRLDHNSPLANATLITNGFEGEGALFIPPFVLAPDDDGVIFQGRKSVWRTLDATQPNPVWRRISPPGNEMSLISALAFAPGNAQVLAAADGDHVWLAKNAKAENPEWTSNQVEQSALLNAVFVVDREANQILAGGWPDWMNRRGGLWRSLDGGRNWHSIGTGLPPATILSVTAQPGNSDAFFVGTTTGLFFSLDAGANWHALPGGPTQRVTDLKWLGADTLVAATWGQGIWRLHLTAGQKPAQIAQPTATAAVNAVEVSFGRLLLPGNETIEYEVSVSPGNIKVRGKQSPIRIEGLVPGQAYQFTVTAMTSAGAGPVSEPSLAIAPRRLLPNFHSVAAGGAHTIVVADDGRLWGWGRGNSLQLSNLLPEGSPVPVMLSPNWAGVAAGAAHSVALDQAGGLWTWGDNQFGQLGDGTWQSRGHPQKIGDGFVMVEAGDNHTVALKADGSVWTWGANQHGQLGDGTTANNPLSRQIATGFTSITANQDRSGGMKNDATMWGWGDNQNGQFSRYLPNPMTRPARLADHVFSAAVGHSGFTFVRNDLALLEGYAAIAASDGSIYFYQFHPNLAGLFPAFGHISSFLIKEDHSLWAWGSNLYGTIGDGTLGFQSNPVKVLENVADISAASHVIAATAPGQYRVWGQNTDGFLGDGTREQRLTPQALTLPLLPSAQTMIRAPGLRREWSVVPWRHGFLLKRSGSSEIRLALRGRRVQFDDGQIAFDLEGNAGRAYRLYQAAFDRTPDAAGLGYWIKALDNGATSEEIAQAFINSAEFKTLYGSSVSDGVFLTALYRNVLHRDPDTGGFAYWLDLMSKGVARKTVLIQFSESPENVSQTRSRIESGIAL